LAQNYWGDRVKEIGRDKNLQRQFLLTLDGGRFRYFLLYVRKHIEKAARWNPIPHGKYHSSTGSEDRGKALDGGNPKGQLLDLEADVGL